MNKLETIELPPSDTTTHWVIWLHGLGADGNDFVPIVNELNLPNKHGIHFSFPHAPIRPITINGGMPMRAWYDIHGFDFDSREDETSINESALAIDNLIMTAKLQGIPSHNILLAGFSQGGAMALHCGLRYPERLAGILALSCYLPLAKKSSTAIQPINQDIPIFQAHGRQDNVVQFAYGLKSRDYLTAAGYKVNWHEYAMEHTVCPQEIEDIGNWLRSRL